MLNKTEPLGLPPGSVPALIALLVVAASVTFMVVTRSVPDGLVAVLLLVVTLSFRREGGEAPSAEAPLAEPYVLGDDE